MSREYFTGGPFGVGYASIADDADRDYLVPQGYVSVKRSAATQPDASLVLSFVPPSVRNDFTGEVGVTMQFTSDQTVTWIGLLCVTGNYGIHKVNLYDASQTLLRSVSIDLTGKTAGVYAWASIAPLAVTAGSTFYLAYESTNGGQQWCEAGPVTMRPFITGISSVYRVSGSFTTSVANNMYVGVDLGWNVAAAATGAAALSAGSSTVAGTGTAVLLVTGTGTLAAQDAKIVSAGRAGNVSLGTGALVAERLSRTNLTLWSQQFENAVWNVAAANAVITTNTANAPDGTLTADTITDVNGSASGGANVGQLLGTMSRIPYSYATSVYCKLPPGSTTPWIQMQTGQPVRWAYFDIGNGVTGTVDAPGYTIPKIEAVGSGWYRCSIIVPFTSTQQTAVTLVPSMTDATTIYSPKGTGSMYLWGAQLEAGPNVTGYAVTTSASNVGPLGVGVVGSGIAPATGTGVLSANISAVAGSGKEIATGTGALTTTASVVTSAGVSRSTGTGALVAQVSTLATGGAATVPVQTGTNLDFPFDSSAQSGTISSTITVPSDAQMVVVGLSSYANTDKAHDGIYFTKGSVQTKMSYIDQGDMSHNWEVALFYLNAPDTGTNKSLTFSYPSNSQTDSRHVYSVTYWKGIDTAAPVRDSDGINGPSWPQDTPLMTALANDKVIGFAGYWYAGGDGNGHITAWNNLNPLAETLNQNNAHGAWATIDVTDPLLKTLYTIIPSGQATTDDDGASWRMVVPVNGGGTQVRVTFRGQGAWSTLHCSVGVRSGTSGTDTVATPVELKFGGESGFSVASGVSIVSDFAALNFSSGDALVIITDNGADHALASYWNGVPPGVYFGYKASTQSWNLTSGSGFNLAANQGVGVTLVESDTVSGLISVGIRNSTGSEGGIAALVLKGAAGAAGVSSSTGTGNLAAVSATGQRGAGVASSSGTSALTAQASTLATGGASSPPAFRALSSVPYGSRPNTTLITCPVGTLDGDIMLAHWGVGNAGAVAPSGLVPPAGWVSIGTVTDVQDATGFRVQFRLLWKQAASEPTAYDFFHTGAQSTQIAITSYSGANSTPLDVIATNYTSTDSATASNPGVTTTVPNTRLIYTGHNWTASGTLTPPTGMTERYDNLIYIADQVQASAGASGARTQTLATSSPYATVMLAFKGLAGAAGVSSSTGTGVLAAASATGQRGAGLSISTGTAALPGTISALAGSGSVVSSGVSGSGALTSTASLAGAGISQSSGLSSLACTAVTVAAVATSQSSGTAVISSTNSALTGSGLVGSFGVATLAGSPSSLTSIGVARWTATGALSPSGASVVSIGSGQWVGLGTLTTGAATVAGSGKSSSQSVSAALLASFASISGFEGVTLISGTGSLPSQSSGLSSSGIVVSSGTGVLAVPSVTLAGAGLSRSTGNANLTGQASVIAGSGTQTIQGNGALTADAPSVAGSGRSLWAGSGALAAAAASLPGSGASRWIGSGMLAANDAAISGVGTSASTVTSAALMASRAGVFGAEGTVIIFGTGTLPAQSHIVTGAGIAQHYGTGALVSAIAHLDGIAIARAVGTGVLLSANASIAGEGASNVSGTATLVSSGAQLYGFANLTTAGGGVLVSNDNHLAAQGISQSTGIGVPRPLRNFLDGAGITQSVGTGTVVSRRALMLAFGEVKSKIEGQGALVSRRSLFLGFGAGASVGQGDLLARESHIFSIGGLTSGQGDLVASTSAITGTGGIVGLWVPGDLPSSYPGTAPWAGRTAVYNARTAAWINPGTRGWRNPGTSVPPWPRQTARPAKRA